MVSILARWWVLGGVLGLSACGGGVAGDGADPLSLPIPPSGPAVAAEGVKSFAVADNGRGELALAWLDADQVGVARFDDPIWQDPPSVKAVTAGGQVAVGAVDAQRRLLLLHEAGQVTTFLSTEGTWRDHIAGGMRYFIPVFGFNGVWAVYQIDEEPPALARYDFKQAQWVYESEVPAPPHLEIMPPALALARDGRVVVAHFDGEDSLLSTEALGRRSLAVGWYDPAAQEWQESKVPEGQGGGGLYLCPGATALVLIRAGIKSTQLAVSVQVGGAWGALESLQEVEGSIFGVRCVSDDTGRSLLVWVAINQGRRSLWAARHDGARWSPPEKLAEPDAIGALAEDFDLAGQSDGEAVVIYNRRGDTDNEIWSRRFVPEEGWRPPRQVTRCCAPGRVAMDGRGMAAVIWKNRNDALWWSRLEPVEVAAP